MAVATTAQLVAPAALSATTTTTLYTVPASTKVIIKEIFLCNTDASARTVTMYVGSGSAAGQTLLSALTIQPGETRFVTLSTVLIAADTIKGGASSANVVSCGISGVTIA